MAILKMSTFGFIKKNLFGWLTNFFRSINGDRGKYKNSFGGGGKKLGLAAKGKKVKHRKGNQKIYLDFFYITETKFRLIHLKHLSSSTLKCKLQKLQFA